MPPEEQEELLRLIRAQELSEQSESVITLSIEPQPGGQQQFFDTTADIAIFGGKAGAGKTWAIVNEPLLHIHDPEYTCVTFRRTSPQIKNPGGLRDESNKVYPKYDAVQNKTSFEYTFPSGARIKHAAMQYENNRYDWQGAQICGIFFDELTHFEESQFFYMLARNRSMCSVKPYIRATTNPDADSWVAKFLAWWIDPVTGYAIPERSGVLRWFVRLHDEIHWADDPQKLIDKFSTADDDAKPKSVTFIIGDLKENKALLENNPGYIGNLEALDFVERSRLKDGNWKIRASSGNVFKLKWFDENHYRIAPVEFIDMCRYWDLGGSDSPKADFTVGLLMGKTAEKKFYVLDVQRGQWTPDERDSRIWRQLKEDYEQFGIIKTRIEWVPGIAAAVINGIIQGGEGYDIRDDHPNGSKYSRAQPVSAATEAGLVLIPDAADAPWVDPFVNECIAFSDNPKEYYKDDQVDGCSGAYNELTTATESFGVGGFITKPVLPADEEPFVPKGPTVEEILLKKIKNSNRWG